MIKLVVFDWNCTILSDFAACYHGDAQIFKYFNLKQPSIKRYRDTFSMPMTDFFEKNGIPAKKFEENLDTLMGEFHDYYEERAKHARSRAGAKNLLRWLHDNGIEAVILSNHTVSGIEKQLKRLSLKKYFDAVLANDNHLQTGWKDKGWRVTNYLKKRHFKKNEVLVVGDAPEEITIARKLGAKVASITDGMYATKRLRAGKPDYLIHRLDELIPIIKKMNEQG